MQLFGKRGNSNCLIKQGSELYAKFELRVNYYGTSILDLDLMRSRTDRLDVTVLFAQKPCGQSLVETLYRLCSTVNLALNIGPTSIVRSFDCYVLECTLAALAEPGSHCKIHCL